MIYFTQDSATLHVKIGYTSGDDAEARRRALQTGNPSELVLLATTPGDQGDERRLHQQFAAARVAGEWFRPVPALLLLICQAAAESAPPWDAAPPLGPRLRFYLAGKITLDNQPAWRLTIIDADFFHALLLPDRAREISVLPVIREGIFARHDYVGPFCFGGGGEHGDLDDCKHSDDERQEREAVRGLCLDAIRRCDVLFAWLDSTDCYGTLAEIGYAKAIGRKVWVASPRPLPDLWFASEMAEWQHDEAANPFDAFCRAIAWDAARSVARGQ